MISIRSTRTKVLCSCILLMLAGLSTSAGAHTASATNASPSDRGRVLIWIGAGGDARWSNPANWEGGRVPTASDAVLIPAGTSETLVDPAFGGHVASLTLDEGYTGTLTLARALNVDGPLDVRGGMVAGGGDALNAQSLRIARGAIVRLGVNGKLKLSGDGTPLTGDGVLDTTTHTPNSVEYSGQATTDLMVAGPIHASGNADQAFPLAPTTFTRTNALTLNEGEYYLASAAIDTKNGFAYFGTYHVPAASVVKVRLSDFTRVGVLTLNTGEDNLSAAVIDTTNGFLYFSTWSSPGMVVKVQLSDFTRVSALPLDAGEDYLHSAVIDTASGFAYFGTGYATHPGRVVKVRLSDFTRIGALTLNTGEYDLEAAVIDTAGGFAYFAGNGQVAKVRLSDFTREGSLPLSSGENQLSTAAIDLAAGFAYFGTPGLPGKVVKVRLSDFTRVDALTLNAEEYGLLSSVIDPAFGYAYFSTDTAPGIVVRVRLSDFTREDVLYLKAGEDYIQAAVMDPLHGFAYFGTFNSPGIVVKVQLGRTYKYFLPLVSRTQ